MIVEFEDMVMIESNVHVTITVQNTCENCKHWKAYTFNETLHFCKNGVTIDREDPEPDFSCSLHEAK